MHFLVSQCQTLRGAPQYQPLRFVMEGGPPAIVWKEKFDHIKERLRAIEGGGNYGFVEISELCLVPDVVIPPKFKVSDFW